MDKPNPGRKIDLANLQNLFNIGVKQIWRIDVFQLITTRLDGCRLVSGVDRQGGGDFKLVHDSIKPPVWSRRFVVKFA